MRGGNKIFVKDLHSGQDVESAFLILSVNAGRTSRGGSYLNIELGDKSGRVNAKVWDDAEAMSSRLTEGSVCLISGYVDNYRGAMQLIIRDASRLENDSVNWPDFLRTSLRPVEQMKTELWGYISKLEDPDYRRLMESIFRDEDVSSKFMFMPAAKSLHHAYISGLLEHSLSVASLANLICQHYGERLNRDLLICGALVHDLGKIWEFSPPPKVDYNTSGRLLGHLVMGAEFITRKAASLESFPEEKSNLIRHLILSHHGEHEFGAPIKPQILEAIVLHLIDNIDAKTEAVESFLDDGCDEHGWSPYHRLFGLHFMRTPPPEKTEVLEEVLEKPLPSQSDNTDTPDDAKSAANLNDNEPVEDDQTEGRLF